jgi:tetratricopeptide (TPR) repeat protein
VSHLIEGSVRKAGNRVRITAQLVKADDDTHLWAENYDRDLTDVFAIQEEIAKAIAASLRVPLGLRQGDTLVRSRSTDEAVYEDYLRAKAIVRARGVQRLDDAVALLESVVARDTEFAPGWAQLAEAYALTRNEDLSADLRRTANDVSLPKAEAAARRAIRLDANSVDGYVSLALVQTYRGQWLTAEDLFKQALTLDPNSSDALHRYSLLLAGVGRPKEALAMRRRLQGLEPFVPVFNESTAGILFVNQQYDAAIAVLKGLPKGFAVRGIDLAMTYAAMGRYSEAADTLLEFSAPYAAGSVEEAARLLRAAPKPVSMPQTLPSFGNLDFVYLYVGAPDRALERDEREVGSGYFGTFTRYLWHPSYAPVRKTERFKAFVRKAGLVDYWRARGWPDLCHPTAGEDFECN